MHDVPPTAQPDAVMQSAAAAPSILPRYDLLEQQHANGARWFYWIAALTVINSLLILSDSDWSFIIGLGLTHVIDGVSRAMREAIPDQAALIGIITVSLDAGIAAVIAFFGWLGIIALVGVLVIGAAAPCRVRSVLRPIVAFVSNCLWRPLMHAPIHAHPGSRPLSAFLVLIGLAVVLTSCGTPQPAAEVAAQSATATPRPTATPRRSTATPTLRPATPTARPPAATPVPPTVEPSVPASPTSSAASEAWTTHPMNDTSIQLPAAWQPLPSLTDEDLEQAALELEDDNPALAAMLWNMIDSGVSTNMRFYALDPATGMNVSLVAVPCPCDVTPDAVLAQVIDTLPQIATELQFISLNRNHQVNGLPAARVLYDLPVHLADGSAVTMRGVQWYIVGATEVFIITISGPAGDAMISVADQIAQSFRVETAPGENSPTGEQRAVINGGNLRQMPRIDPANVIGQVCPGDQVALLDQPAQPNWVTVRVAVTGPDCDPQRVPAGTEGWVSTSLLGPVPEGGASMLPPSLPITKLVPFTHEPTGISGLRPDNWTVFATGVSFQISSSPEAPDGFLATFTEFDEHPPEKAAVMTRSMFGVFKENRAAGPPPEIHEEQINEDGSGVLLVTVSASPQGSTQSVRVTAYLRATVTPHGLLTAIASVPAETFPQQEALVRQMVDSVRVAE